MGEKYVWYFSNEKWSPNLTKALKFQLKTYDNQIKTDTVNKKTTVLHSINQSLNITQLT